MTYPTKYKNMSKMNFLSFCADNYRKDNVAVILFLTPGSLVSGSSSLDDEFNIVSNNETVNCLAKLPQVSDSLIINIEDTFDYIGNAFPLATKNNIIHIDTFLKLNYDKEVIAVCDAGVSRSGFITWYLDKMNKITRDWKKLSPYEFKSQEMRAITSPLLTKLAIEYFEDMIQ